MEKNEKSIITYLLQEFPPHILKQITFLHENFPISEESQDRLNETIYSYFKYFKFYDIEIIKLIQECCLVASIDSANFIPDFLNFFPQIPLDMENSNFDAPIFLSESLKNNISTSLSYRYSTFYVINSILTDFFYKLVVKHGPLKKNDIEFIFQSLIDILFKAKDIKNALQMNLIFVPKLSIIVYFISISIPDIVFEEAKKYIQKVPTENAYYQYFTLRFFSSFIYPKNVLTDHLNTLNSIFPPLINYIISNKSVSNLLVSSNEFFRNFLGNVLKSEQSNESLLLIKEINKMYNKIQSEQILLNSTLILFSTLSTQTSSLYQISRFFTNITKQISTKAADVLKTFTVIINGPNYCPHEICKITGENFRWRMNKSDTNYLTSMIDIIIMNKNLFSQCQSKLANFFTQLSATKFAWFVQHHFNRVIEDDFFNENGEAVIEFSISILSPKSPFLQYSNIHHNDPIILQFRNQMQRICVQILDTKSFENANGDSVTYITNSFTKALKLNSLEYEIDHIIDNTTIVPLNKMESFQIDEVLQDWKNLIQGNTNFSEYINTIDESELKTFEQQKMVDLINSGSNNMIIKALTLYFITEQIEGENNNNNNKIILNKIPMFLLSKSPLLSAFTIRLLQAFVHVNNNTSALETLLTIQAQQHEEIYIFGLALLNVVESLVFCGIKLSPILYESIFAWQCALLASPFIQIRELGFKLAEAVISISPENSPNIAVFIKEHEDEISQKSIEKFLSFFSIENISGYRLVQFRNVSRTSSYLLYHVFLSTTFSLFDTTIQNCQPSYHKIFQAQILTLINSRPVNQALLNNHSDCFYCLNLMTIRLATTSSFDQITTIGNLKAMLQQAKKILNVLELKEKISLSFFSSINPLLNYPLKTPKNGNNILILCYTIRFYRKSLDISVIEKYFREIIEYLNLHDYIRTEIHQINTEMLHDVEKGLLPMSLCHMMYTLNKVFKKLAQKFVCLDTSSFLRTTVYKFDGNHPFDPNYWFPFLFNIVTMPPLQFPFLMPVALNVISVYCGFTQIPYKFVNSFIQKCANVNTVDLYTSIIKASPDFALDFFASKSTENIVFFRSICKCFKKPNSIKKDVELLFDNIKNRSNKSEIPKFDTAIYEHIGSLLANSSFYLCYNNGSEREISFKLIYHISLFSIVQGWPGSNILIPILDDFSKNYLNASFPIPMSQLLHLQKNLSIVFHSFSEQFLSKSLHIISSRFSVRSFIESIVPWFENVVISAKYGIVPNSIKTYFTPYSFISKILAISFRKTSILDENFIQTPMPINSVFIVEKITKSNPLYFVDFILFEKITAKPLLLYLALNYQKVVIPYLLDFFTFDFAFHEKIKKKNDDTYKFVIKTVSSVMNSLLNENVLVIESKLHLIFLYFFIHFDSNKFRKNELIEKVYNFFNVKNEEEILRKFNEKQIEEVFNEAFKWMISYGEIEKSTRAIQIFSHVSKIRKNQEKDIKTAIKIIASLLYQSKEIKDFSLYCNFISKILIMMDKIECPLIDFSIEFLKCNSFNFSPLFETSLSIISKYIDRLDQNFDLIFYRLITADLNQGLVESVFNLIVKMVLAGFPCDKNVAFFTLIPFIYLNGHHSISVSTASASNFELIHTKSAPRPMSIQNFSSSEVEFKNLDPPSSFQEGKKSNLTSVSASNFANISSMPTKKTISTSNFQNLSLNVNNKQEKENKSIIFSENSPDICENNEIIEKLTQFLGERVKLVANLPSKNFISNEKFNNCVLKLISSLPGETQFFIVSFFMEILSATKNDKYFSIIYMISMVYLSMNTNELPISPSVFTPLSHKILLLNSPNGEIMKNFIKVYENFKTPFLPSKSCGNKNFPFLNFTKDLHLSFEESTPFVLCEDCFSKCSLTNDLKSLVLNWSIKRFEKRDKEFEEGKALKVPDNQYFPKLEQNCDEIIERIKEIVKIVEKKQLNLSKKDVLKIQNVNYDIFKVTLDDVSYILDC